jgi:hypothetical protein
VTGAGRTPYGVARLRRNETIPSLPAMDRAISGENALRAISKRAGLGFTTTSIRGLNSTPNTATATSDGLEAPMVRGTARCDGYARCLISAEPSMAEIR